MDKALLISSFLLLIVTLIKCTYASGKYFSEIYLCLTLFCLLILSVVLYLFISGEILNFIHFYRVGGLAFYTFVAGSYLYISKSISKKGFSKTDLLFFIPAILYLMDMSYFFIQSADIKRESYLADISSQRLNQFSQGVIFPDGFHNIIQNVYGLVLSLIQIYMITRFLINGGKEFYKENSALINWFYVWALLLFFACLPDNIIIATGFKPEYLGVGFLMPYIILYLIYPVSLLVSPGILYGIKGVWMEKNDQLVDVGLHFNTYIADKMADQIENGVQTVAEFTVPPVIISVSAEDQILEAVSASKKVYYKLENAEAMKNEIENYVLISNSFLDIDYSINKLAKDTGYSVRQVSSLLNDYCNLTFRDYINTFRIVYFINKFDSEEESKKFTMEALAKKCGFTNRYTFIHAFKKQTGKTPTEFFELDPGDRSAYPPFKLKDPGL